MPILLLGDSHLARLRRGAHRIGRDTVNLASGGAFASDLHGQAVRLDLSSYHAVVVSIGTNDAAPWKQNAVLQEYADRAAAVFRPAGARIIDTPELVEGLGPAAFADDGVHLTGAAYDVLIPVIAAATS